MPGAASRRSMARGSLATLALAIFGALSATALAGVAGPTHQASLDKTVRFLQNSQQLNGGFAAGGEPGQGTSAWVALALAAVGINPQDQALPCGSTVSAFLTSHFREGLREEEAWPGTATTAFERELLVVDAAGTSPHDFAGFDLVAEILGRQLPDGSFPHVPHGQGGVNDTIFAILALSPIHEPEAEAAIQRGAEWLIAQQNEDHGWYFSRRGPISEVDMTAAAIQALVAAGTPDGETQQLAVAEAQEKGLEYLKEAQLPDGGFPALPNSERESNVASTAWAVQGLWAAGLNPETWTVGSGAEAREPLNYLESMQDPADGHERWRASQDLNGIWMTAYVTPALAGQALPIPVAARSGGGRPSCKEPGQGGESPQPGNGVIAGGGGDGAPFFSRPKAGSKGKTPGGARIVHNKGHRARNQSKTRRGDNAAQPTGTETEEASASEGEASAVASSVGSASGGGPGGSSAAGVSGGESPEPSPTAGDPQLPAALVEAASRPAGQSGGHEVTGTVIGSASSPPGGNLAFGAPGLHSAGAGGDREQWIAVGIGVAALLMAMGGALWERRRLEAIL
jgi:hypothetical protein